MSIGAQPWLNQHVILLQDGSHLCTCLMLINKGIICRHFIKVLTKSAAAFFNISLIPSRWYNDQAVQFSEDEIHNSPLIQLCNTQSKSVQTSIKTEFLYLSNIRGGDVFTPELKGIVSQRQQYAKAHELQKKAYNLATRLGQGSEYINLLKDFIYSMENSLKDETNGKENINESQKIANPIYIKPRGRPPQKRHKSSLEQHHISRESNTALSDASNKHPLSADENNDTKRMKKCGRCKQAGHDRRTCNADLSHLQ